MEKHYCKKKIISIYVTQNLLLTKEGTDHRYITMTQGNKHEIFPSRLTIQKAKEHPNVKTFAQCLVHN